MPVPHRFGRGAMMGRGPYEKSGLLDDTALPVGEPVSARYEIPVPAGDSREPVEVRVKAMLWYLPGGKRDATAVLWREEARTVEVVSAAAPDPGEARKVAAVP